MQSRTIQFITLFFGVFALSTSAIFVRLAGAPASITAFYRLFFASILLLPALFIKKENRTAFLSLSRKQWALGCVSGLFLAVHYVLWFESLRYTSVASSTVIVTLQPLFSFVGGYFLFQERFSKKAAASCLIAMGGCVIIGWGDFEISGQALLGDMLAFIAAGVITAYFFVGQHMRKQVSVIPYSILGYASGSLFLGFYSLFKDVSFTGYPIHTWKAFVGLALISTILGQMIFNWLLKWLSTTVVSMSILGETIGTCLLAYFILGETVSFRQSIGIIITLTGLAIFLMQKNVSDNG